MCGLVGALCFHPVEGTSIVSVLFVLVLCAVHRQERLCLDDVLLHFNRNAQRRSPMAPILPPPAGGRTGFGGRDIWKSFNITSFRAQVGPTGGSRGYERVTGQSGWGISWWINEELIPVLHVERRKTYTFVVEGGVDASNSARYHPFYITDNSKGGGSKEDPAVLSKKGHRLLAGVVLDARNKVDVSKGTGRYCEWTHKTVDKSDESSTWEDFKQTLNLQCDVGQPANFTWTPDKDTPDVVYYQCFTHYYLGWKIMVTDPDQPERGRGKDRMESGRGEDRMESGAGLTTALLPLLLLGVIVSKAA